MIIFYFGADKAWSNQDENAVYRRNMAILLALSKSIKVEKVFNVVRSTRKIVLNEKFQEKSKNPKIENIYIAPIFPESNGLKRFTRPLNNSLLRSLYPYLFKSNQNILSWCYWPKGFLDYEYFNLNCAMVFDTDHNIIDDPNIPVEQKEKRKLLLLKIAKQSKYIISSSRSMLQWYTDHNLTHTMLIMNGVVEQRINLSAVPNSSDNYQVTYCGTLSKWIESSWLIQIIEEHPQWTFNFIGKDYKTDIERTLQTFSNVRMYGFLEPTDVNVLLKQSNVCFGLYKKDAALDVNSMKLYDYLSQGLPVVVNDYHEYLTEDFNDLLNVATTYDEFKAMLKDPKPINKEKLQEFLRESTWDRRIEYLLNVIND